MWRACSAFAASPQPGRTRRDVDTALLRARDGAILRRAHERAVLVPIGPRSASAEARGIDRVCGGAQMWFDLLDA